MSQRPFRIAILASNLKTGGGRSVGSNLIRSLIRIAPEWSFFMACPDVRGYEETGPPHTNLVRDVLDPGTSLPRRIKHNAWDLARRVRRFGPDVILCLGNFTLPGVRSPQLVLCHDAHYWSSGQRFGPISPAHRIQLGLRRVVFGKSIQRASLILAQTPSAAKQICTEYSPLAPVRLCPNAVSEEFIRGTTKMEEPEELASYRGDFLLLYPTKYIAHKNFEALVEVFRLFRASLKGVRVVLTVRWKRPGAKRLRQRISELGLADFFINVGPISQSALASHFRCCRGMLMPSLLESFSSSYLEAMCTGSPVLTSDADYSRDVCGDAALYFDPFRPDQIRDAILLLRNSPAVGRGLRERGLSRFRLFPDWNQIAIRVKEHLRKWGAGEEVGMEVEEGFAVWQESTNTRWGQER